MIPGDDAAPEAVHATVGLVRAIDLPLEWVVLPDGAALAETTPPGERESLIRDTVDSCDTALFGATSGTTPGIVHLRWGRQTYANVRPVRWRPGYRSPLSDPEGTDYVIVRENLEDLYAGMEGDLAALAGSGLPAGRVPVTALDGRYAVKVVTREGALRAARFSCRLAEARKADGHPGKVTVAGKWNVLPRSDGFFRDVVRDTVAEHPGLTYEEFLLDDFARRLVAAPRDLDVVVLQNLYGDVLSDEGAGTIGGLGLCPSGCYGDDYAYFESVHGSAPDIAGQHVINPTATILSAVLLLRHLGFSDAARRLEAAVDAAYAAGDRLTPDQGGTAATEDFVDAVRARL